MSIRDIIKKLEEEKIRLTEENNMLTQELALRTMEKAKLEKEINDLKTIIKNLEGKDSLVDDMKVEEAEPQETNVLTKKNEARSRRTGRKKIVESEEL